MSKVGAGEEYLAMYPHFHRWMNTCAACGHTGYKPEMPPNDDPAFKGQNLRKYFRPLALNDAGLCEQCGQAMRKS